MTLLSVIGNDTININGQPYYVTNYNQSVTTGGYPPTYTMYIMPASTGTSPNSSWITWTGTGFTPSQPIGLYPLPDFILKLYTKDATGFKCKMCKYNEVTSVSSGHIYDMTIDNEGVITVEVIPNLLRKLHSHLETEHPFELSIVKTNLGYDNDA